MGPGALLLYFTPVRLPPSAPHPWASRGPPESAEHLLKVCAVVDADQLMNSPLGG